MKHKFFLFFYMLSILGWGEGSAQEIEFSKETFINEIGRAHV